MKVFLTGASGYIGGSVATALLAHGHRVVGLVRNDETATGVQLRGIEPVQGVIDDTRLLTRLAAEADAVVNAANVDHRGAVEALLLGLKGSKKPYIQTSGTSVVADAANGEPSNIVYSDDTPFPVMPARASRAALNARVIRAVADGVSTSVILPPMVYGRGTGLSPDSVQVPQMIDVAKRYGEGKYVGRGANRWSNVHIEDLADLYVSVLLCGAPGQSYFAENGELSMKEIAECISRMLGFEGRTGSLTRDQAIAEYGELKATLGFGSNSRVRATRARFELGWNPYRRSLSDDIERGSYALHLNSGDGTS